MKYLKIFLLLAFMAMALATTLMAASTYQEEAYSDDRGQDEEGGRSSRFLAQKPAAVAMTCDKYPRTCRAKGSPGPDCCGKRCVNVLKDKQNCGKCGKKCKYYEMCCKGKCVNTLSDKKNCGGCNNKCKKGNACVYGMCNYA